MTASAWMRVLAGRRPAVTFVRLVAIVGVSIFVFGFWLLPTFEPGSLRFVNTFAYVRGGPERADVVAIRMAGCHVVYVKRVIGLPGERVYIAAGIVFVNGTPIDEPYVELLAGWDVAEVALERDEFFVVGDNRGMRAPLHDFGVVRRERVIGKILF